MTLKKFYNIRITLLSLIAIVLGAMPAASQSRHLPASHESSHNELLANQRPAVAPAATIDRKTEAAVRDRENIEGIYSNYWESQSVNPYGNIEIPATKAINVSEGVVPVPGRLSSPYGWRARFGRMHRGVDLSLNVGDTVRAAFSGKVRLTKYEAKGYGYYVVIRHDNGMETVYGHLSKFIVKPNQRVEAGEPIALGGNTGRSTGPHLHFETRYLGLAVNPEGIFDFAHGTTFQDIYTFDKKSYESAQVSGPAKKSSKGYASKSSKKRKKSRR